MLCQPFRWQALGSKRFTERNPVRLAPGKDELVTERRSPSALTTSTWFFQPLDWTIFNSLSGAAAPRRSDTGPARMGNYYAALAPTWEVTSAALCKACEDHGFDRLTG